MAKKIKASKISSNAKEPGMNQGLLLAGVVGVGVLLIIAVVVISQLSAGETQAIGESETYAGLPVGGQFAEAREVERGEDVPEGVERGINEDGIPYVGGTDAPIIIAEVSDFTCPACMNYHPTVDQIIEELARDGRMQFWYLPAPAASRDPYASNAARAALCAGEQGGFWEMHDEIFRVHRAESNRVFTPERLESLAEDIGLDGGELRACMNTNRTDAGLFAAAQIAQQVGANSTPTVLYSIDGGNTWNYIGEQSGGGRAFGTIEQLVNAINEGS